MSDADLTDLDSVRPVTWEVLDLLFRSPLFVEHGVGLPPDEKEFDEREVDRVASTLERMLSGIDRLAHGDEDWDTLKAFSAIRPIREVQWRFVAKALLRVRPSPPFQGASVDWKTRVAEAFGTRA